MTGHRWVVRRSPGARAEAVPSLMGSFWKLSPVGQQGLVDTYVERCVPATWSVNCLFLVPNERSTETENTHLEH